MSISESISISIPLIISIIGYTYIITKYKSLKKLLNDDGKLIEKSLLFFIFLYIVNYSLSKITNYAIDYTALLPSPLDTILVTIITSPFDLILSLFPVVLGMWIVSKTSSHYLENDNIKPNDLKEKVEEIWNSQEYLTALRTVLPKGEKDEEFGLDYIPFMLQNINERRSRYKASSEFFLKNTIILGLFFSALIIYFGYILVNDDSTGLAKSVSDVEHTLTDAKELLLKTTPLLEQNQYHKYNTIENINNIREHIKIMNYDLYQKIDPNIFNVATIEDLSVLTKELAPFKNLNNFKDEEEHKKISSLINELEITSKQLSENSANLKPRLEFKIDILDNYISEVKKNINNEGYKNSELIKRLAIGFIVSTFFLAVLRYVSSIYKEHHAQMLKAEMDELSIRKYYVAFKSSSNIESLKKESIISLFERKNTSDAQKEEIGLSLEETSIIKELMSILTKKIT